MSAQFAIGQRAAIYQSHFSGGIATPVTVERDTKLYWVADGRKFRKSDGLEPGSAERWGRARFLLPLSDPRVAESFLEQRKRGAYSAVTNAQEALAADRENARKIQALKDALDTYAETLN